PFHQLRRAARVDTPGHRLAFGAHYGTPARRAGLGHLERPLGTGALALDDPDHLRDDVARLLDHHRVADADVLLAAVIFVVQGGPGGRRPGDPHRIQDGHGRDGPRAAHVDHDVPHHRRHLFGRELVGDGPAGALGRHAQALLVVEPVHLDDDPVDLIRQRTPLLRPVAAVLDYLADAPAQPP